MRRTKWPITSGKDALKIKGIGQGMADRVSAQQHGSACARVCRALTKGKIDEWINGGQGRQFYETNDQVKTVQIFKDIYGVGESTPNVPGRHNTLLGAVSLTTRAGRARANEFYHQGARTIDDLKSGRFELTEGQRVCHLLNVQ